MIMVLAVSAVLWAIGAVMDAPKRPRLVMQAVLFGAVILIQLTLPDGHPLRQATGSDLRLWVMLAVAVALGFGYWRGLSALKAKVRRRNAAELPQEPAPKPGAFTPQELSRYARHLMLREIGGPGQRQLKDAKVLVIGAGGLGAPALLYLAASGVGTIGIVDDDIVEDSNLQRQVIHTEAQIGVAKTQSAKAAMQALNRHISVVTHPDRLTETSAKTLFQNYDLVLDGTDNFETRYAINAAAIATGTPLIAAALTQWEGQISLYNPAAGGPCFACLFPAAPDPALVPSCAEAGVAAPLPGILGAMMAMEAVKHITGAGAGLMGRLMIYDALYAETRVMKAKRNPECATCAGV
ncbi:MAG: molybdopterin-synthase adenylyltransferase MoeB [Rhodobacteraceae bacterium]|nr:molybdopterin-synthase adenylyltransferase MoeB [Paracoccaceae bacterium]